MKFEELKQSLQTKVENFYSIYGEDDFMKDSAVNQIKYKAISSFPELNYTVFSLDNLDEKNFFETLNTVPFISEKKVVVLKIYDDKKIPFTEKLIEYLKNPSSFCIFILQTVSPITLKGTKPTPIDCNKISDTIIKKFISIEVNKNNCTISSDAIDLLILYCNGNMSFISSELNKCISYTNNISIDTIKELVSKHTDYQIFEFTDSLGKKLKEKTMEIMNSFLNDKNILPLLISLLYNHYRRLYFISISNKTNLEISEELNIKEYAVKKLKEQLKLYSTQKLSKILLKISDNDYKIKNGEIDIKTAIYDIVFNILIN